MGLRFGLTLSPGSKAQRSRLPTYMSSKCTQVRTSDLYGASPHWTAQRPDPLEGFRIDWTGVRHTEPRFLSVPGTITLNGTVHLLLLLLLWLLWLLWLWLWLWLWLLLLLLLYQTMFVEVEIGYVCPCGPQKAFYVSLERGASWARHPGRPGHEDVNRGRNLTRSPMFHPGGS